jgi:hypothetical protein
MKYLKKYNTFILEALHSIYLSETGLHKLTTTYKEIPEIVDGSFYCNKNHLKNLIGSPRIVNDSYNCSHNELTSLVGAPEKIGKSFDCSYNKLTSLNGGPREVYVAYNCSHNNLTTLLGATKLINRMFNCSNNKLKNLDYLPEINGWLYCYNNDWLKPIPYNIMIKYNLHATELPQKLGIDMNHVYTKSQFEWFSSFEYQKDFLEREPENYLDLKPLGYAKGIEDLFPHLFDMDELGLIN